MKTKTLIFVLFVFFAINSSAQLKFEGEVDSKYKTYQLDDGSFRYVIYNKKQEVITIFNLDNTIWRTVKIPLPKHHVLDELKHISVRTLNDDDFVELIYSCAVYYMNDDTEDPEQDFHLIDFTLNIINEHGEHLLKVQDSNEMKILDSNGEKKLIIYKHIGKGFNAKGKTLIYSL
jgi:hypothetical protein